MLPGTKVPRSLNVTSSMPLRGSLQVGMEVVPHDYHVTVI